MSAQLKFTYWPLAKLKPQTKINPRAHTAEHVKQLAAVIERYGFRIPILVDRQGRVVAGHRRLLAAKKLKLKQVPVVLASDLDDDAQRAFMIADNKVARLSQREAWDEDKLAKAISYLQERGYAPESMAFTDAEFDLLKNDLEQARADRKSRGATGMRTHDADDDGDGLDGGEGQVVTLGATMTPEQREEVIEAINVKRGSPPKMQIGDALHAICMEWLRARR